MTHFPNVILNVCYGPQGYNALSASKITESIIENNDEAQRIFPEIVVKAVDSKRMLI